MSERFLVIVGAWQSCAFSRSSWSCAWRPYVLFSLPCFYKEKSLCVHKEYPCIRISSRHFKLLSIHFLSRRKSQCRGSLNYRISGSEYNRCKTRTVDKKNVSQNIFLFILSTGLPIPHQYRSSLLRSPLFLSRTIQFLPKTQNRSVQGR